MDKEIWKNIEGYNGKYQISNFGRVKSFHSKNKEGRILKNSVDSHGYCRVTLVKNNKKKYAKIHRLVAEYFIPKVYNCEHVNHMDENKKNNKLDNLEWCTQSYNNSYGTRLERVSKTQSLEVLQFDLDGNLVKELKSVSEGKKYGFNPGQISMCCLGKSITHKNNTFRYKKDINKENGIYKIDKITKSRKKTNKKVYQYDIYGNFVNSFESALECSEKLKFSYGCVCKTCRGKYKQLKGYVFKYETDVIKND